MTISIEAFISELIEKNNEIKDRSEIQSIETTSQNIILHVKNKKPIMFSIYDFIDSFEIDLGNSSKIVYVGETDFPTNRPFDKPHLGMMKAIYNYKNVGNDIFIYYNVFHIKFQDISNSIVSSVENTAKNASIQFTKFFTTNHFTYTFSGTKETISDQIAATKKAQALDMARGLNKNQ
jgi:hypothetical protein